MTILKNSKRGMKFDSKLSLILSLFKWKKHVIPIYMPLFYPNKVQTMNKLWFITHKTTEL